MKITVSNNGVKIKSSNRRIDIIKPISNKKTGNLSKKNVLIFKALTKEVGKGIIKSHLSCKGKVKTTGLSLSEEATFELYHALHYFYRECPKTEIPQKDDTIEEIINSK
jgi:hypothetical protein